MQHEVILSSEYVIYLGNMASTCNTVSLKHKTGDFAHYYKNYTWVVDLMSRKWHIRRRNVFQGHLEGKRFIWDKWLFKTENASLILDQRVECDSGQHNRWLSGKADWVSTKSPTGWRLEKRKMPARFYKKIK